MSAAPTLAWRRVLRADLTDRNEDPSVRTVLRAVARRHCLSTGATTSLSLLAEIYLRSHEVPVWGPADLDVAYRGALLGGSLVDQPLPVRQHVCASTSRPLWRCRRICPRPCGHRAAVRVSPSPLEARVERSVARRRASRPPTDPDRDDRQQREQRVADQSRALAGAARVAADRAPGWARRPAPQLAQTSQAITAVATVPHRSARREPVTTRRRPRPRCRR